MNIKNPTIFSFSANFLKSVLNLAIMKLNSFPHSVVAKIVVLLNILTDIIGLAVMLISLSMFS